MRLRKFTDNSRVRGDTLVEVLFATATAALLIVITLILMNRNLAQIQMSVESTFVRQAIDSQAEVLRYVRDQYMENRNAELNADGTPTISKLWKDLVDSDRPNNYVQTQATDFGTCQPDDSGNISGPASNKAFFINNNPTGQAEGDAVNIKNLDATHGQNLLSKTLGLSQTYARPGQGIWVEAINPNFTASQSNRYVDFHIRACWDPPFVSAKATLGTIVRLYYETPTGSTPPEFVPMCRDGLDNDSDSRVDFPADPGCANANDNNETDVPPPPPPIPPINIVWSNTGAIPGRICVRIWELLEGSAAWDNNYLCSTTDYGLQWQISFTVPAPDGTPYKGTGPRCTYFDNDNLRSPGGAREGESDALGGHAWDDNYLCSSTPIGLEFRHSLNPSKDCININEPGEVNTWPTPATAAGGNNPAYLCFRPGSP